MNLRNFIILVVIFLGLGGYFYFSRVLTPPPPRIPEVRAWEISGEDLWHFKIELTKEGKSEAFVKGEDGYWHFDDPQQTPVNRERWGGQPRLLRGPLTKRIIAEDATQERLAAFGLTEPRIVITMTLTDGRTVELVIGDSVPDGTAFYLQVPNSNDVAIIDHSWYVVFERLVILPPYPPATD